MSIETEIREELKLGGPWLGAARTWAQSNILQGDTLPWTSTERVSLPFCFLTDLALEVAVAAIKADRARRPVK